MNKIEHIYSIISNKGLITIPGKNKQPIFPFNKIKAGDEVSYSINSGEVIIINKEGEVLPTYSNINNVPDNGERIFLLTCEGCKDKLIEDTYFTHR